MSAVTRRHPYEWPYLIEEFELRWQGLRLGTFTLSVDVSEPYHPDDDWILSDWVRMTDELGELVYVRNYAFARGGERAADPTTRWIEDCVADAIEAEWNDLQVWAWDKARHA